MSEYPNLERRLAEREVREIGEAGDTMQAQRQRLDEVADETSGRLRALGQTLADQGDRIGNAATEMTDPMEAGIMQSHGSMAVEPRFDVEHVAETIVYIANLPLDTNIQFMTIMATKMPYIGRG